MIVNVKWSFPTKSSGPCEIWPLPACLSSSFTHLSLLHPAFAVSGKLQVPFHLRTFAFRSSLCPDCSSSNQVLPRTSSFLFWFQPKSQLLRESLLTKANESSLVLYWLGFPCSSVVKNLPANAGDAGDTGLIPGLGKCSGKGNGNPLQYSCLGNPIGKGAWLAIVYGGPKELGILSN